MYFPKIKNSLAASLIVVSCFVAGAGLAQADTFHASVVPEAAPVVVLKVTPAKQASAVKPAEPLAVRYTVVSGDTLSGISQKFYYEANDYPVIVAANSLSNPDLIYPAQVLVIPPKGQEPSTAPAPPSTPAHKSEATSNVPPKKAHHSVTRKSHQSSSHSHHSYSAPRASGSPKGIARSMVSASDFQCLDYVISHESGWHITATNSSSGAYGLGQALPGSKMASAGADWRTNPATQLRWVIGYMDSRYGSVCEASSFWRAHLWY